MLPRVTAGASAPLGALLANHSNKLDQRRLFALKPFPAARPCVPVPCEEEARTHEAEEAGLAGACLLGNHDTLLALGAVTIIVVVVVDDDLGLMLLLLLILRLLHHHWLGCHHHGLLHHDWLLVNGHHHFLRILSFKIFI
jgi:hypothetical protein